MLMYSYRDWKRLFSKRAELREGLRAKREGDTSVACMDADDVETLFDAIYKGVNELENSL